MYNESEFLYGSQLISNEESILSKNSSGFITNLYAFECLIIALMVLIVASNKLSFNTINKLFSQANVQIDFHEYFVKKGVTIIEWSDLIADELPRERLEISFRILGENKRMLIIKPYGKKYEDLCEAVL